MGIHIGDANDNQFIDLRIDGQAIQFKKAISTGLRIRDIDRHVASSCIFNPKDVWEDLQLGVEMFQRSSTSQSRIRTDLILKEGKLTQHTPIPEASFTDQRRRNIMMHHE
ncbi:hypothetical protein Tco_1503348 [Tanacetum coccineum]